MIDTNLKNKANLVFPGLFNVADEMTNENAIATEALWKNVSDKWVDITKKHIAPVRDCITDVITDLQVRNPKALPVVQVEVVTGAGSALVDPQNYNQSELANKYVDVTLHNIVRPFTLSIYDVQHGERIESKLTAAIEAVLQGVYGQFVTTAKTVASESAAAMSPETAASISAAFGASAETDRLILDPVNYAKLVPTNGLSLNPATEGVYGIGKIYKSYIDGGTTEGIALAKDGIVGSVATREYFNEMPGCNVRHINVDGIPMVIVTAFDWDTHTIKCSVETLAGFAITDESRVKTYTFA